MKQLLVLLTVVLIQASGFRTAAAVTSDWPKADPAAVARWQAMRFGMFIHWGPVSLTGEEIGWSRGAQTPIEVYDTLYQRFNPTNFDADAWVSVAKAAGMKYVVFTTKHHDGFCMFDTRQTDFNIMHSPFHRDVVKELSAACRKQGLAFGTYYSTCDWHHPDFPLTSPGGSVKREKSDLDAYNRYLLAQVSELITNYGPLITLWCDVPQMFEGRGANTIKLARRLQPDIVINDRTGDGGDFSTPEQHVGNYQHDRPWETCMTICQQWAWKPNDTMKSLKECLEILVSCAGGDGNLLLNVGPMPDGRIEPRQVERLKEMGAWLNQHGNSIYGTRGGPWKPRKGLASTRRGNTVFVHVLRADEDTIKLPGLPRKINSATLLGGGAVASRQDAGKLVLTLPRSARDPIDTIVQLELDGSAMDLPAAAQNSEIKATASNVFQNLVDEYGPDQALDDNAQTRWATDAGTRQAWIRWDTGKLRTVRGVRIDEAIEKRVQEFQFEYLDGQSWKTVFTDQTIGHDFQRQFEPLTAREFRLNIFDASEGPTINEIRLIENK
jgi:alpha-L-fucosidase